MSLTIDRPDAFAGLPRFIHGDEFFKSLGDIPISRILFNPSPGWATEAGLHEINDRGESSCELVDGTLVEKTLGYEEGLIAIATSTALTNFVKGKKLGIANGPDGTMKMARGTIRLPDVSFVSVADLPDGKRPWSKAPKLTPSLAIGVISTTNTRAEMRRKTAEYFESGSTLVWVVHPVSETVAVFDWPTDEPRQVLTITESLTGDPVLPGFSMPLAEIFHLSDFEQSPNNQSVRASCLVIH